MPRLLAAGWALEQSDRTESTVAAADLRELSRHIYEVDLAPVAEIYPEAVFKVRDLGIALSDRRAVKVLKLLAASAVLCGRRQVLPADLWVLRYVWDREEQIGPLGVVVNGLVEQYPQDGPAHPLAAVTGRADGEEIARQLEEVKQETEKDHLSLTALARLRERVAGLADRAAWVADDRSRNHLLEQARQLRERLG